MPTVLFVDDDLAGSEPVALYLQRAGYVVVRATNGRDGLAALTGPTPDLILLDVRMPKMDGLEFLAILRSYMRWQHIPVILLTAYADLATVIRAAERFDADVVNKAGIDLGELVKLIAAKVMPPPPPESYGQLGDGH